MKRVHPFRVVVGITDTIQEKIKEDGRCCNSESAYLKEIIEDFYNNPRPIDQYPKKGAEKYTKQCQVYLRPMVYNKIMEGVKVGDKVSKKIRPILINHFKETA
jgi:hypothetical protein